VSTTTPIVHTAPLAASRRSSTNANTQPLLERKRWPSKRGQVTVTQSLKNEPNTTDATIGKGLRSRVEIRKAEIESAIAKTGTDKRVRGELEIALGELDQLLSGDLDHIPKVVAAELSTWLEANKHIDEHHPVARPSTAPGTTPKIQASSASVEQEQSRDKILKLLSETELAQVSTAEEAVGLAPGDEYIDLEHLEEGVHAAPVVAAAASRMLPRSAVSDDTWRRILAVLG